MTTIQQSSAKQTSKLKYVASSSLSRERLYIMKMKKFRVKMIKKK